MCHKSQPNQINITASTASTHTLSLPRNAFDWSFFVVVAVLCFHSPVEWSFPLVSLYCLDTACSSYPSIAGLLYSLFSVVFCSLSILSQNSYFRSFLYFFYSCVAGLRTLLVAFFCRAHIRAFFNAHFIGVVVWEVADCEACTRFMEFFFVLLLCSMCVWIAERTTQRCWPESTRPDPRRLWCSTKAPRHLSAADLPESRSTHTHTPSARS